MLQFMCIIIQLIELNNLFSNNILQFKCENNKILKLDYVK